MSIKRILLPACDTAGFEPLADSAFTLGRLLGAQVRTLFAQPFYLSFRRPTMQPRPRSCARLSNRPLKREWRRLSRRGGSSIAVLAAPRGWMGNSQSATELSARW